MAQMIRNTHELATIRIRLRPSRSGLELSFTSYLGTRELERCTLPAEAIGIQHELSVQNYRGVNFALPEAVLQPLVDSLLHSTPDDEPCWLQIGASAGRLGIVPWEQYLQPMLNRSLLRIPNFLADPVFLRERLRAAIVVSSPVAKTPFSVVDYARAIVANAQEAVSQGTELHLFADLAAYDSLREFPSSEQHTVIVHDPHAADDFDEGGTRFLTPPAGNLESRLKSPWLRWIRGEAGGKALDMVHFVCPGYFRRDQGALALARSPGVNDDRQWSHFVGADELIAFLDLVGAWAAGFTPPYENVWAIGLRLLADRLAWQRPGPLFVHDVEHGTPQVLYDVYRYLFAAGDQEPPLTANLSLYSHPRRMQRYRTGAVDAYESVTRRSFGARQDEAIPEQLVMLAQKADRYESTSDMHPHAAWAQANGLQLDRMLLDVGNLDTPARRGALDALEQVRHIFDDAKTLDK